jgi:hypothetical protein
MGESLGTTTGQHHHHRWRLHRFGRQRLGPNTTTQQPTAEEQQQPLGFRFVIQHDRDFQNKNLMICYFIDDFQRNTFLHRCNLGNYLFSMPRWLIHTELAKRLDQMFDAQYEKSPTAVKLERSQT